MSAELYVMNIEQNTDYESDIFEWLDPTGAPVDLTGVTAVLTIRTRPSTTAPSLVSIANGTGISLGGALGTISWVFTPTQTAALPAGEYFYTMRLVLAGKVYAFVSGLVEVVGSTV